MRYCSARSIVTLLAACGAALVLVGCVQGDLPVKDTASGPAPTPDTGQPDPDTSQSMPDPDTGGSSGEDTGAADGGADVESCVSGSTRVCGTSTGICEKGTQTCKNGQWGACEGGRQAATEICDGKDNDCNGQVDEISMCSCTDGETQPCGKSEGVCEQGMQTCKNGSWGACMGKKGPQTEVCDGKDNDCDGQVDEGGCNCTNGETQMCGKSQGVCQQGTQTCNNGSWGSCTGKKGPQTEVCDGKDNDCDGQTDENGCSCTNGQTRPCGPGTGECRKGTQTCSNGQWGNCMGKRGPQPETCDGRDNNCNGMIDESLTKSCGTPTGQCQEGTSRCNQGTWGSCQGNIGKSKEVCDGKDNDCDGQTDENITRSCGTSTGQCQTGSETCNNGSWGACQGQTTASPETCDGKDNDCNGKVDDNLSRSCGKSKGVCTTGTEYCSAGSWGSCQNSTMPSKEKCDYKDNDCDGQTDEWSKVLKKESFEGGDSLGWQEWTHKGPGSITNLKISDDKTGNASDGSEYAQAWYKHGTCKTAAGIGEDFKVDKDIDIIKVDVRIDIPAWGHAAIWLVDSNGNLTKLWEVKGKGQGYSTNGWKALRFNEKIEFKRTTSNGKTTIEQNQIPIGVGNEEITLIFGNGDTSSHCANFDHDWKLRVDNIRVIGECF